MKAYLFVLNKDEDTIYVYDSATEALIKVIPVDHNPHEIIFSQDGLKTYVSCSLGNAINVIDNQTLEITKQLKHTDFDFPHGLGLAGDGSILLASTYSNKVIRIDPETDEVTDSIETGEEHSHMIAMVPNGHTFYVPNIGSHTVTVMALKDLEILRHIPVGKGPEGVAVHPNGKEVYVANQHDNTLMILNTVTDEVLYTRKVGACPIRVVFSPDAKYALVPNRDSGDLSVILTAQEINGQIRPWEVKRIPIGKWPGGTVFNQEGTLAYVANNKTNDISVIDMTTLKEIRRIEAGIHPDGIGFVVFEA